MEEELHAAAVLKKSQHAARRISSKRQPNPVKDASLVAAMYVKGCIVQLELDISCTNMVHLGLVVCALGAGCTKIDGSCSGTG